MFVSLVYCAESTVHWFVVREKHCWMTADCADKSKRTGRQLFYNLTYRTCGSRVCITTASSVSIPLFGWAYQPWNSVFSLTTNQPQPAYKQKKKANIYVNVLWEVKKQINCIKIVNLWWVKIIIRISYNKTYERYTCWYYFLNINLIQFERSLT
jgi:hypothetical protein